MNGLNYMGGINEINISIIIHENIKNKIKFNDKTSIKYQEANSIV